MCKNHNGIMIMCDTNQSQSQASDMIEQSLKMDWNYLIPSLLLGNDLISHYLLQILKSASKNNQKKKHYKKYNF